ncbi:DUF1990 domain-containing protein [Kineosporia succinea]|uniref:Uncharacterized protein (UPF0548 family) n=1 Tax=Kineosporia succinea TaxID=84632 RepID=A0ABT9NYP4_9ACTN|nr:DUF1990 domain-containing protein [Kineosporia succinea]MDP9825563.1 uncharacterized protein (UPF0548 family) [Kineosporia succinea]
MTFALRPDLDRALAAARRLQPGGPATWLERPPPHAQRFHREVRLPGTVADYRGTLFGWEIHRGAGLRIAATGDAALGATVVLGIRLGPVWAMAPCRVVDVTDTDGCAAFTYAALPGHPEAGAERFAYVADGDGVRFELSAVSREAFWGSRLLPVVARKVQRRTTDRYLAAARP